MSDDELPAWAEAFVGEARPAGSRLQWPAPITPDWAYGDRRGRGVRVAVIDSGIDASHPDVGGVAGAVALEFDPDTDDGYRTVDGPHDDLYGHGTACAAIIRALAPDVELYSVRVLGAQLTGKAFIFAAGIEWALEHGMHVVNLSLSTANDDYYAAFHELADRAVRANVMLISAMNNVRKPTYPSEYSSVFSVAAHDGLDPEDLRFNTTPPAEWGAPGIEVRLAWLEHGHVVATGNSFATPHVAGHVARIVGAHPDVTPWQVKSILAALAH
jgi:subtilisin family serine protease